MGLNTLKSMEILSVISQVSAVEGCPLSGVPLFTVLQESLASIKFGKVNSAGKNSAMP